MGNFTYKSSNSSINVSSAGVITPASNLSGSKGTATSTITVTYTDGTNTATATCSVRLLTALKSVSILENNKAVTNKTVVTNKPNEFKQPEGQSSYYPAYYTVTPSLNSGNNCTVSSACYPAYFSWSSSNEAVAYCFPKSDVITDDCLVVVKPNVTGTATIKFTAGTYTSSFTITASKASASISGLPTSYTIYTNATPSSYTLKPTFKLT